MDDLERRIVGWATRRRDIRTVLVIGSRAQLEAPADEWSDLDVVFVTQKPAGYLANTDWLSEIAEVWAAYADPYDDVTRHVLFAEALDAGITPVSSRLLRVLLLVRRLRTRFPMLFRLLPRGARDAIERRVEPAKVREQPAGATGAIFGHSSRTRTRASSTRTGWERSCWRRSRTTQAPPNLPPRSNFRAVVDEFLFLSVWNAKHLRRGELWWAKTVACDGRMKTLLLRMIEWHAGASAPPKGRRFERWVDPQLLDRLRATFGHYDDDDVWRASSETVSLFRTIAAETAERLGFDYPVDVDTEVARWVGRCEADSPRERPEVAGPSGAGRADSRSAPRLRDRPAGWSRTFGTSGEPRLRIRRRRAGRCGRARRAACRRRPVRSRPAAPEPAVWFCADPALRPCRRRPTEDAGRQPSHRHTSARLFETSRLRATRCQRPRASPAVRDGQSSRRVKSMMLPIRVDADATLRLGAPSQGDRGRCPSRRKGRRPCRCLWPCSPSVSAVARARNSRLRVAVSPPLRSGPRS